MLLHLAHELLYAHFPLRLEIYLLTTDSIVSVIDDILAYVLWNGGY